MDENSNIWEIANETGIDIDYTNHVVPTNSNNGFAISTGNLNVIEPLVKLNIHCPACDSHEYYANTSVVYTSNPPKYRVVCKDCGHVEYIETAFLSMMLLNEVGNIAKIERLKSDNLDDIVKKINEIATKVNDVISFMEYMKS